MPITYFFYRVLQIKDKNASLYLADGSRVCLDHPPVAMCKEGQILRRKVRFGCLQLLSP
ncbi:hypothetical protein Hanom_Chr11g01052751 [Helianthus anomalus]